MGPREKLHRAQRPRHQRTSSMAEIEKPAKKMWNKKKTKDALAYIEHNESAV